MYSIGLSQRSLLWFNAYLRGRRQYVGLQNTRSTSLIIGKGVPQGSVLGPLLFSVYINDMPSIFLSCNVHLYADDTVLYTSYNQKAQVQNALQSDFIIVQNWLREHNLLLNEKKTCTMLFKLRPSKVTTNKLQICMIDGRSLENVNAFKYLGLWLDTELSFNAHIEAKVLKVKQCSCQLYRSIDCFTFDIRKRIAQQLLLPLIDYADIVYHTSSVTSLNALDLLFNSICRFVLRYPFMTHHCTLYEKLDWLQPKRRRYHWYVYF